MSLSQEESAFLHRCIYDYFNWCNDDAMVEAMQEEHPDACRFSFPILDRPLLVSTLLNHRESVMSLHIPTTRTIQPPPERPTFIWNDYYEILKSIIPQQRLPPDTTDPRGILSWCVHQRWVYKNYHCSTGETNLKDEGIVSHLTKDRIEKLNALGFQWELASSNDKEDITNRIVVDRRTPTTTQLIKWKDCLETFKPYLIVPPSTPDDDDDDDDDTTLPKDTLLLQEKAECWLMAQIERYRDWDAGFVDFTKEQRDALQELNLLPDLVESEYRYLLLDANEGNNNDDDDDDDESENDSETEQEHSEHDDQSTRSEKQPANNSHVPRNARINNEQSVEWKRRLDQLIAFQKMHGHLRVTQSLDRPLSIWVGRERTKYRKLKDTYPQERKKILDDLGFCWDPTTASKPTVVVQRSTTTNRPGARDWTDRMAQMTAFKNKYGHVHVTNSLDPNLSSWAKKERIKYRQNKDRYPEEKKRILDELGFCWEPSLAMKSNEREPLPGTAAAEKEAIWWQRFEELKAFQKRYGYTKTPGRTSENKELANWYRHTRERYRGFLEGKNRFPKKRQKALEDIGIHLIFQRSLPAKSTKQVIDTSMDQPARLVKVEEERNTDGDDSTHSESSRVTNNGEDRGIYHVLMADQQEDFICMEEQNDENLLTEEIVDGSPRLESTDSEVLPPIPTSAISTMDDESAPSQDGDRLELVDVTVERSSPPKRKKVRLPFQNGKKRTRKTVS